MTRPLGERIFGKTIFLTRTSEFGQDHRGGDRDEGREDELMSPEDVSSSSSEEMIFIRILPRNTRF
jgi:hypothetical protein